MVREHLSQYLTDLTNFKISIKIYKMKSENAKFFRYFLVTNTTVYISNLSLKFSRLDISLLNKFPY